ncbi:MAG: diguanylate cyclase [Armatimonadetes bacterium]|nr:diguanylate cyclase [Armatimonadota bacterium]
MMTCEGTEKRVVSYRLISYFAGLAFAVSTYILGLWIYSAEISVIDHQPVPDLWPLIRTGIPSHPVTFFGWIVLTTLLAVAIGHLFDRQVFFRRAAEMKANVDGLTGMYNHRYFQDRLTAEIERAQRYNRRLSLVILDLDDFKNFNDQRGHQEGDRLLRCFAGLCKSLIRAIDVPARYGGEEFVIIMPETGPEEARSVADRIRQELAAGLNSKFPDGPNVTLSAGIASYPEHAQTRHTLVLNADTALYFAKKSGKNKAVVYEEAFKKIYCATSDHLKALLYDKNTGAIEALSAAVDAKDHYTRGHSDAVTRYSMALARRLGISGDEMANLRAAALLHDIGKIGTPDSILQKPGPLQMDEWQVIEDHPKIGSDILEKVQQMNSIVPGVRHHHERFDGLGYPSGLSGQNIPLIARIIALADAYDAMVSRRNYRDALSHEEAMDEIRRCAGTQFDPELVVLFLQSMQETYASEQEDKAA